jgi:hypothetical protein
MNDPVRQAAVRYLWQIQSTDGGFVGYASLQPTDFTIARAHPTAFFTALILHCLRDVPGTGSLQRQSANFLLRHKSDVWSWNYLKRTASPESEGSYPDDLDDTVCALAALSCYNPGLIDGTVLGHLAQLLIANEEKPGGPYGTWLVDRQSLPGWHNVDSAVNANIGYFLSLQSVQLPALTSYITSLIGTDMIASAFYIGQAPVMYFLARWYRGEALGKLRQLVQQALLDSSTASNSLTLALLISAACQLDCPKAMLELSVTQLLKLRAGESWPVAAFCYGPPVNGKPSYAGSAALSTAFALEALQAYDQLAFKSAAILVAKQPAPDTLMATIITESKAIKEPELQLRYRSFARQLIGRDHDSQITAIATRTALSCQQFVSSKVLHLLNLASLQGWMAYTIYDDILDDEANTELLGVANVAQRQMIHCFRQALPAHPAFQALVYQTLLRVDGINTWEVSRARAKIHDTVLRIRRLPDYADYDALWQRSWGHMLVPSAVLTILGYGSDSHEQLQLQTFFCHYLIARQLNDDAHDWETDLKNGHCSAVVTLLLKDYCHEPVTIDLGQELGNLQVHFWQKTILKVTKLMQTHLAAAEQALAACSALKDPAIYHQWLEAISNATDQALAERREAQAFIAAYQITAP